MKTKYPSKSAGMVQKMRIILSLIMVLSLVVLGEAQALSAEAPQQKVSMNPSQGTQQDDLDYALIRAGGDLLMVKNRQTLTVWRGDKLLIQDAVLTNGARRPGIVNIVGYDNPAGKFDDRGVEIDTGTDLRKHWSVSSRYEIYQIKVMSNRRLNGVIFLQVEDPRLRYAVVSVNERQVVVREGEILTIDESDQVQVRKVVTTLPDSHENDVTFQMVASSASEPSVAESEVWELRFFHRGHRFADLPIRVRGDGARQKP